MKGKKLGKREKEPSNKRTKEMRYIGAERDKAGLWESQD